jgi:tetratricopeptide (TPR) repeat protein
MRREDSTKLSQETVHRKVQHAVRLAREKNYGDALLLFEMYLPLLSSNDEDEKRLLTEASSFCGLCLAMEKHRYAEALEYCTISLKRDIMNADHRANVALVYLERGDRRHAVKHLHEGLRLQSNHPRINEILDKIGRRRPPMLGFLARENPINVLLGKLRGTPKVQRPRRSTDGHD